MKTYQLLRNNKSMGYYTEICLLQIGLQPLDLLWIDGESITWKYPSELEEFRAHVSKPAFSQASLVNSLKEKQILYFESHIAEMGYKKLNMELIDHPDAMAGDMTPGFEYMLRAQNMRLNKLTHNTAEISDEEKAVEAVRAILNKPESAMKSGKVVKVSERETNQRIGNLKFVASSLTAVITGLIALASASFINFRF